MLSVSRETETCIIELFNDFINFRITIVKPYLEKSNTPIQDPIQNPIQDFIQDPIQGSIQDPIQDPIQDSIQDFIQDPIQSENFVQSSKDSTPRRNPPRFRQRPTRFQNNIVNITVYMFRFMPSSVNFQTSRLKKLNELLEKGVFKFIYIDDLFIEARVFESRFVNQMKNEGTEKAFEKSRFVV